MRTAIINGKIYADGLIIESGYLVFENGIITSIGQGEYDEIADQILDVNGRPILPGLIDIQVNGCGGASISDMSVDSFATISTTLVKYGVTSYIGAIDSKLVNNKTLDNKVVLKLINNNQFGAKLLGFHLEGPFINQEKIGANDKLTIREPDIDYLKQIQTDLCGEIKILTMAPELNGALKVIAQASNNGIVVGIGHSLATFDEAYKAFDNGAVLATHMLNAMNGIQAREPGIIGALIEHENVFGSLICDGNHVNPTVIKLLYRALTAEKLIVITDSALTAGTEQTSWTLNGHNVIVNKDTCFLEDGTIAGSNLMLSRSIKNFRKYSGCGINEAIKVGSENPAKALHLYDRMGGIAVGKYADVIVLNDENTYEVSHTFVNGELKYLSQGKYPWGLN